MKLRGGMRILGMIALVSVALLVFSTCKKQDERNGIVGAVSVDGGNGAGATVNLYDAPSFDAENVWVSTASHTNIGFPYTPDAAFEWRTSGSNLRASVSTGSDGKFNFPDLTNGQYVVVARKDSFGWSSPVQVNLGGSRADAGTIGLSREHYFLSDTLLDSDMRWAAGQHYVLLRSLTVGPGATLTIEPGAVVRIGEAGGKITVRGTLLCEGRPDSYIRFTSNESPPTSQDWQFITFVDGATPPLFRYCSFSFGTQGIRSIVPGGRVEHCCFTNIGAQAINLTGGPAGSDSAVVRYNVLDHLPTGVWITGSHGSAFSIDHNAIFGCSDFGVRMFTVRGGSVYCNLFFNNGREDTLPGHETGGLYLSDVRNLDVSHNLFDNCWWGMSIMSKVDSSTYIHHNTLSRESLCFYVGVTLDAAGPSFPTIHLNCIPARTQMVKIDICQYNTHDVDADSNYWAGYSGSTLEGFIRDCNDPNVPRCPCVLHPTILTTCPDGAGLCND